MPVGFGKEIEEIALAKGGKLTVAGAGRDNIDNGFILAYGGIEENCTIRAMFDAKRDELSDIVHRLLFIMRKASEEPVGMFRYQECSEMEEQHE